MRKKILTTAFIILLIATAGMLVGIRLLITGATGLDDWVMRQVLGVAQTYLVPTIEFDEFSFTAPGTVTYHGVRLVAPDGVQVVEAGELVVTLGKAPKRGEPITIEGITIRDGTLHLIADPGDPETTFKGLAPFVKKNNFKQQDTLPREVRLSETLDLRAITLDNASVIYDPGDGQPEMRLDAMTLTMDIEPSLVAGEVWHRLDLDIDRGDLFRFIVDGRFNLDELAVELDAMTIRVDAGSESVAALPPQLQQILADYDARGDLEINLTGAAELERWRQSDLSGALTIDRFNMALGEYRIPIDHGEIPIKIGGASLTLGPASFALLDGLLHANAGIDLQTDSMPTVVEWSLDGLDLRELLRTAAPDGELPRIAGILGSFGSAQMDFTRLPESIDGRGEAHITDGILVNLPGVRELNTVLDVISLVRGEKAFNDSFDVEFTLTDQGIKVDQSKLTTNALIARGTGMVYYDKRLDLRLNAGPLERVESLLGEIGAAIGQIFEKVIEYRVTGTLGDPKVTVNPLGFGT